MENVFITGGTGLLGAHLIEELLLEKKRIITLIRDEEPLSYLVRSGNIKKVVIVKGSLEDFILLERILNEYEIDTVFHLGAQTLVPVANNAPLSTFESNIRGTYNLLEASRRCVALKRFILASSDKAYGESDKLPYTEDMPLKGIYPYDVSKVCAEFLTNSYWKTFGLKVVIVRCGNLFGPGDLNFNRIIPQTIKSLLQGKSPVIRSDGKYVRDYIYVKDAVRAIVLLAKKMDELSLYGEVFNISSEKPYTVMEIVEKILEIMDSKNLKPVVLNQAKNEIKKQYLSNSKIRKILGWKPVFTLEQGIKESVKWYSEILGYL